MSLHAAIARQRCMHASCRAEFGVDQVLTSCPACAKAGRGESLLDLVYDWDGVRSRDGVTSDFSFFLREAAGAECSGVWQFRELLPFYRTTSDIVSVGEGKTILQKADALARLLGMHGKTTGGTPNLYLQYEGMNPSGSFKDNGMSAGFTHARMVGAKVVACASTGNTSASLALYAAQSGLRAFVFIGAGKIAFGKLSQALDYGATTLQVAGDFDACLARVRQIAENPRSGVYLLNSVNPFRLEGQKTIMCRVLRDLGVGRGGGMPDWIVVPGGNLGNCSAFAKAFMELRHLGMIDRVPRLAVINAHGARTLDRVVNELGVRWTPGESSGPAYSGTFDTTRTGAEFARMDAARERAHTIASAIEINRPVNLAKALRALSFMNGVVRSVDDDDILEHKALVGRLGYGCEPASAASVAGTRKLLAEGVIRPDETVVCILTGHQLKDPDATVTYHTGIDTKAAQEHIGPEHRHEPQGRSANRPIPVRDDVQEIMRAMGL
ncbi:MAG: threonine synthase [Phycisphaerales bacterium]|nr:threonine synthase [Phycisphaerales bacterium]